MQCREMEKPQARQRGPGAIGVRGDPPCQRQGIERGRHDELLAGDEAQPHTDGDLGQPFEHFLMKFFRSERRSSHDW